jgi:mannose-6-phosphate isomerase
LARRGDRCDNPLELAELLGRAPQDELRYQVPVRPIRLKPDNFTPPSRTPWGGVRLLDRYKAALGLQSRFSDRRVGESWEFSVSDEFPSVTESGESLSAWLARDPGALLGDEARRGDSLTALLVKWLDAGDHLSLQIHPEDDYAGLAPGESGKLEGWYVVEHDEGAGLYMGFAAGVRERDVREALERGADLSALMAFVPVQRGDFVLLEPGTPHAVGKGLTLIEPQVVVPGRRGVTYRYWDWNRRYGPGGVLDGNGKPRELHIAHALAVTRWDRACDPEWLASRLVRGGPSDPRAAARCEPLCGPLAADPLQSALMRAARLFGTGGLRLPAWNSVRAVTVIEGRLSLGTGAGLVIVPAGTTAVVPAACLDLPVQLEAVDALLSAAVG